MTTVADKPGIAIASDLTGQPKEIAIDLQQHPEVVPELKRLGLLPKAQFDIDFENGIPIEEARKNTMKFINKLWQK